MHQSVTNYTRPLGSRQPRFSWYQSALAVWEHKWIALVTLALVITGTLIWMSTLTPLYRATAVLEVDKEDAKLPDIQNATSADMFDDQYFNTQQQILQSRTLCEKVIDSLPPDERQQILLPGAGADADFTGALQDGLSVEPVRESRLIQIHVDHSNPQVAALLANGVAREFIKRNLEKRMATSTEAVRWLRQQAEGYQEQAKQTHTGVDLASARSQQSVTSGDINDLKTMLEKVTNPSLIPAIANNPEVAALRQRLKEKQIEMAVLRERYKPQHPAMIALQTELDETEQKLTIACNESLEGIKATFLLASRLESSNIQLVDPVRPPSKPFKPNKKRIVIAGVFVGLISGIGLSLLAHSVDSRIRTYEDVDALGLPLLCGVPHMKHGNRRKSMPVVQADPQSIGAEAFRNLRASLHLHPGARGATTLLVTSTAPAEGKSLVAANLSLAFASNNERTLLIDADMYHPIQHQLFSAPFEKGLSLFLTDTTPLKEIVHKTDIPNLDVITVGDLPNNPAELLGSSRLLRLLEEAREQYQRIVIDTPPVTGVSDPLVLLPHVQGVVFVVGFGKIRREIVTRTMQRLRECEAPLLGVVLNNIDLRSHARYYYPYRYSYNYRRKKRNVVEESQRRAIQERLRKMDVSARR
jgi:polysaccharide biosynthesis transport protein